MNKRIVNVTLSLNKTLTSCNDSLLQCDRNTNYINLNFLQDIDLASYQLLVFYKLPHPEYNVLVDAYDNLRPTMQILIPNGALKRSGDLVVEFALQKGNELITIDKNMTIEVLSTINGTYLTADVTGNLCGNIDQQVSKLTDLIKQAQGKINEYNTNVENKKKELDTYVDTVAKANVDKYVVNTVEPTINQYVTNTSKPEIDRYVTEKENQIKGATFIPSVSPDGDLSFTNDKGLPNPTPVNIRGPQGPKGDMGNIGPQGLVGPVGPMGPKPVSGVDYNTPQEKNEFKDLIISQFDNIKVDKTMINTIMGDSYKGDYSCKITYYPGDVYKKTDDKLYQKRVNGEVDFNLINTINEHIVGVVFPSDSSPILKKFNY